VKIQVTIFQVVTQCSGAVGYHRFGGPWYFDREGEIRDSKIFRNVGTIYKVVSKSFRTGHMERELQMVQLSATRCSCTAILWVSLVSFATITFYVASQLKFIVVYFVIDSVRKLLDTPSYMPALYFPSR